MPTEDSAIGAAGLVLRCLHWLTWCLQRLEPLGVALPLGQDGTLAPMGIEQLGGTDMTAWLKLLGIALVVIGHGSILVTLGSVCSSDFIPPGHAAPTVAGLP